MTTSQFRVPDISCDHCVRAITKEVTALAGVAQVTVDIPTKVVTVNHADVASTQLVEASNEAGFDTVEAVG